MRREGATAVAGRPVRRLSRRRHGEAIEAGAALFGTRAYRDIETTDICEACSLSPEDFYAEFRTKRDFFLLVVDRMVEKLMALTEPADPARPLDDFDAKLVAFFDFVRAHPQGSLAAIHHAETGPELEAALAPLRSRARAGLALSIGLEQIDPNVDLVLWGWTGLNESIARRLILDPRVDSRSAARLSTLGLIQLVEESLQLRGRELPAAWSKARRRIRREGAH